MSRESSLRYGVAGDPLGTGLLAIEQSTVTRLHVAVFALCAVGFGIDLLELGMGGALSAVYSTGPSRLGAAQLSWLVSAVYLGAIVGAPAMGWLADRIGSKRVLALMLCWMGVTSCFGAASSTPGTLSVARLLSGLALGGYPPIMIAYLTDILPSHRRGLGIFASCALAYLAPPLAIFVVRWLTPIAPLGIEGWRWPLAVAGVLSVLAGIAFLRLPEAPHWLMAARRLADVRRVSDRFHASAPVAFLNRGDREARRRLEARSSRGAAVGLVPGRSGMRLAILALVMFTIPIATVSFPLLTGPILLARHFTLSDTLFYAGLATFGPVAGTFLGGFLVDRFDRRRCMAICATGMALTVGLFFLVGSASVMAFALIAFALLTSLYMPTMTMYGAELFQPEVRARSMSIAWVANRIAAAGAPILLVPLVRSGANASVGLVLGGSLVANLIVVLLFAPREDRLP